MVEAKEGVEYSEEVKIFEGEEKTDIDFIVTIGGDGNLLWISKLF